MASRWRTTKGPQDFAEAVGGYRVAIALRPDDFEAFYNLGGLLSDHGDHAGSAACNRAVLARNPKMNFARINLSGALEKLGDLDGAIAISREAVQFDPTFWLAHTKLAWALLQKADLDGSIAEYKETLRLEPKAQYAAKYLHMAERMRPVLPRLPAALAGTDRPASPTEALGFALWPIAPRISRKG
jgi:tetratricopeptide (TPR) repeat protein